MEYLYWELQKEAEIIGEKQMEVTQADLYQIFNKLNIELAKTDRLKFNHWLKTAISHKSKKVRLEDVLEQLEVTNELARTRDKLK